VSAKGGGGNAGNWAVCRSVWTSASDAAVRAETKEEKDSVWRIFEILCISRASGMVGGQMDHIRSAKWASGMKSVMTEEDVTEEAVKSAKEDDRPASHGPMAGCDSAHSKDEEVRRPLVVILPRDATPPKGRRRVPLRQVRTLWLPRMQRCCPAGRHPSRGCAYAVPQEAMQILDSSRTSRIQCGTFRKTCPLTC